MATLSTIGLKPDEKLKSFYQSEQGLFRAKRQGLDDQLRLIEQEISEINKEKAGIQGQIESTKEAISYKEERVRGGEELNSRQFIEKNQFLMLKEDLAAKKETLAYLAGQMAANQQRESELRLRKISAKNEYIKIANDEYKESERQMFEIQEKIRPAEISLNRYRITAPVDGQVIDLKLSTVGGIVRSGDPIMDIVPVEHDLILEVKVRTMDIELVHIGQKADVQLLAYSTRKVPHIPGQVVYVSGDAIEDKNNSAAPAHYLAHIKVDPIELRSYPGVELTAGMPVTAYLQTKERTFIDMILKPVEDSLSRGLRRD